MLVPLGLPGTLHLTIIYAFGYIRLATSTYEVYTDKFNGVVEVSLLHV